MLPNREGLFHAYLANVGVDETGPNNLATCIINFRLFQELSGGEWTGCEDEDLDITGYFYLEKKDRSLNQITLDALKAALGWDGRDPFWLQDTDLSGKAVQVKLGFEEYNGKTRLKVQFLNPYGSTGGGAVTKADETKRRSMSTRLGAKFRAMAGAAPASPPKPAAPPAPPKAAPPAPEPEESTLEEAWAAFAASDGAKKLDQEGLEKEWFRILADLFPGKQPDDLTPAEWARMRDEGPGNIVPF